MFIILYTNMTSFNSLNMSNNSTNNTPIYYYMK